MDESSPRPEPELSGRLKWLISETLVIVLGVLIALAVDRAVQSADEQRFETVQLRGLANDFEEAASVAASAARQARWRDELGQRLLQTIEGHAPDDLTASGLAQAIEFPSWHYLPPFPKETWDDLINTGRLGAISNAEIRRAIARFYRGVDQVTTFHADWIMSSQRFRHDTTLLLPARSRMALTRAYVQDTAVSESDLPPLDDLIQAVRNQPDLSAHLSHALLANSVAVDLFTSLESEANRVRELLRKELGN